ncbi:MAG: hypothetical protein ACRELT_18445 [Longimicrobiales bacterium]
MNLLLEHAARVLDHQPTRSMEAEPLHRRTVRETGVPMPFPRFMDAVRRQTDRFAVIPPDPVVGAADAWDPRQRSLYEAAMETAGMTQPLIVLAERRVDAIEYATETAARPGTAADVFRDAQDTLTHLLHAVEPDDPLYAAITAAMEELHAVTRVLKP